MVKFCCQILVLLVLGLALSSCNQATRQVPDCKQPALEAEPWLNTPECNSASDLELTRCVEKLRSANKAELDRLYTELEQVAGKQYAQPMQDLKVARTAWEDYAATECRFEADDAYPGTAQSTHWSSCMNRMTRARIQEVKILIENFKNRP